MSTKSFLEAWAYIMIILVCFTILLTFIVCFLVRFIKKRRRRRQEQQQTEKEANRSSRHSKYQSAAVNKHHESHFGSISSLLFSCTVCSKPTPRANNCDSDNEKERHSSMNEKQLVNTTAIKAENNDKINYDYDDDEDKDETRNMKNGEVIINETSKKRIDYLNINRINTTINNNNDTSRSGVITKSAASSKIRNPNSTNNRQNAAIGVGINQIQTMPWKITTTNTNNITRKPEKLNNSVNYNMIYQNQQLLSSNKKLFSIPIQDEDQIESTTTTMNQTSPNSNSVFRFIYDKLKLDMWLKRIEPEIIIEQKPKQKSLDIQERFVLVDDEDEENRGNIFKSSRRKLPQLPVGNKDQRRNSSLPMSHHSVKFKPIEIGSIETPTASSIDSGGRNYDDDENYDSFYDQSATNGVLAGSCSSDENENYSSQIPATSSSASRRKYSTCSSSLAAPSNKLSGNKHWVSKY